MTELVVQRTTHDCGPCCLAMLTGRGLDAVIADLGDAFDPERGLYGQQKALERLGFASDSFVVRHRAFETAPEFFLQFSWGRRALITVPSLNKENGWHMVFWDGARLYDPSAERRYDAWPVLKPDELVLFRETTFGAR